MQWDEKSLPDLLEELVEHGQFSARVSDKERKKSIKKIKKLIKDINKGKIEIEKKG